MASIIVEGGSVFNFTREERQVILFLTLAAFIGMGVHFLKTSCSDSEVVTYIFAKDLGKVNVNTANKELLMSVSGVGEKLADRIIEYRQNNGNFRELIELKKVKGINNYRFEKIRNYLIAK